MDFFEQELRKIVSPICPEATFVGRACYIPMDDGTRCKLNFVTGRCADNYEALKASVFNRSDGHVDSILIRFSDLFGKKQVSNPNFRDGVVPHIWVNGLQACWYAYQPTEKDYAVIRDAVSDYLSVFQTQEMEVQGQGQTEACDPGITQTMSM